MQSPSGINSILQQIPQSYFIYFLNFLYILIIITNAKKKKLAISLVGYIVRCYAKPS